MSFSQEVQPILLKFLSSQDFDKAEFKDIYYAFINNHPQFKPKKYYSKIYKTVRDLEYLNAIRIDKSFCTFKYSTINDKNLYLDLTQNSFFSVKKQLFIEYNRIGLEIHKMKCESEIFDKYILLYPSIKEKLSNFLVERQEHLLRLEFESSTLNIIMNNM